MRCLLAAGAEPAWSPADQLRADLLSALLNLGYHRQQAEKAIDATVTANPNTASARGAHGAP